MAQIPEASVMLARKKREYNVLLKMQVNIHGWKKFFDAVEAACSPTD